MNGNENGTSRNSSNSNGNSNDWNDAVSIVTKLKQCHGWRIDFEYSRNKQDNWNCEWRWNSSVDKRETSWIGSSILATKTSKKEAKRACAKKVINFLIDDNLQHVSIYNYGREVELLKMGFKLGRRDRRCDNDKMNSDIDGDSFHCNYFEIKPWVGFVSSDDENDSDSDSDNQFCTNKRVKPFGHCKINRNIRFAFESMTDTLRLDLYDDSYFVKLGILKELHYFTRAIEMNGLLAPNAKTRMIKTSNNTNSRKKQRVPYPCHLYLHSKGQTRKEFESS